MQTKENRQAIEYIEVDGINYAIDPIKKTAAEAWKRSSSLMIGMNSSTLSIVFIPRVGRWFWNRDSARFA